MDSQLAQRYHEFKSFITYVDILTYALALSSKEKFNSEPDKWHEAVYEICKKYRNQIPELKRIYFTYRPPLPPQSEQVDRLIKIVGMSREISMPNWKYPTIDMDEEKKKKIKKREKIRQAKYQHEIDDIKHILEGKLSVNVQ